MVNPRDASLYKKPAHLSEWEHSESLDEQFGFECLRIENEIARQSNFEKTTWKGLHPQVLQTPYSQIYHFLNILKPHSVNTLVDFGAAYSRAALVMSAIIPEAKFIGYEVIQERFLEAKRVLEHYEMENSRLFHKDITHESFIIPVAEVYFIYDFSKPQLIKRLVEKIINLEHQFFIVARGNGVRSIIQHYFPVLTVYRAYHQDQWSLYSNYFDMN